MDEEVVYERTEKRTYFSTPEIPLPDEPRLSKV